MATAELFISKDVVDKIGQCSASLGTDHTDASNQRTVHRPLYEAEDVLYTASCMGPLTVAFFLLFSQWMVLVALLANNGIHATLLNHTLLALISGIKP